MVENRIDDGTPLNNPTGGDDDDAGANRALLTQDEDERAPDDSNIVDDANANDNQEPPQARAGDGAEFKVWNGLWPGPGNNISIERSMFNQQKQQDHNGHQQKHQTMINDENSQANNSSKNRAINAVDNLPFSSAPPGRHSIFNRHQGRLLSVYGNGVDSAMSSSPKRTRGSFWRGSFASMSRKKITNEEPENLEMSRTRAHLSFIWHCHNLTGRFKL